jgi:hypothetical protein
MDNEKAKVVAREYVTDLVYDRLIGGGDEVLPERDRKADAKKFRKHIEMAADEVLSGRAHLADMPSIPDGEPTLSDKLRYWTAGRITYWFGLHHEEYDAFFFAGLIDCDSLADRVLRRYVPEYVPSEAHDTEDPFKEDEG